MRDFKIQTILCGRVYEERDGVYTSALAPDEKWHIMDFLTHPSTVINKILRKSDNVMFAVGDVLQDRSIIRKFYYKNKIVMITDSNGIEKQLSLVHKYVAPVAQAGMQIAPENVVKDSEMLNKLQAKILAKERPTRIRILKKHRPDTVQEFLTRYFLEWNIAKSDDNERGGKDTIYVDTEDVQTVCGKRRSLGDLFILCRYYYPACTLKEVVKCLVDTLPKKITEGGFRSSWCNQITKRTYYFSRNHRREVHNTEKQDEYGFYYKDYLEAIK